MNQKRVDMIELQLTPKQWANRLANEMRRYPSEEDFLKAIAKGTYRQSPFTAPFYVLAKQAADRWPGPKQEHVRAANQLNRKLRGEFHALKLLITNANETIKNKVVKCKVKAALRLFELHAMILGDAFEQTARKAATWIERCTTATADEEEERQSMLKELLVHADLDVVETMPKTSTNVTSLRRLSVFQDWADNSAMLLTEIIASKAAVQTIQERYFDNCPILFKDTEGALETAIQTVRDAILLFDEYQEGAADPSSRGPNRDLHEAGVVPGEPEGNLSIDIEAIEQHAELLTNIIVGEWETSAKNKGTGDILEETGEHGDFVWQNFRKTMGVKN